MPRKTKPTDDPNADPETEIESESEETFDDPVPGVELHYFRHVATNAVHAVDSVWAAIFKSRKTLVRISKDEYDDETSNPV